MKLLLLAFVLIPACCGFVINHGDKQNTTTDVHLDKEGDFNVIIQQDLDYGSYYIQNRETDVDVEFFQPNIENEEDAVVYNSVKLKEHGKNYNYDYSTSNMQARHEEGKHIKDVNGSEILEVKGNYAYPISHGRFYVQNYTADKNGFRTKISFGTDVDTSYIGVKSAPPPPPPQDGKGIDGALLCSLAGSGCKK